MNTNNLINIENETLSLTANPSQGELHLRRRDRAAAFGPLVAWARFQRGRGTRHQPVSSVVKGWEATSDEVETPFGPQPGVRLKWSSPAGLPVRLIWEAALLGGEEVLARLTIENRDDQPLRLFELSPLAYRGADPGLEMGAGYSAWRFYRTGYQSWSPGGSVGVMERDFKPRLFFSSRSSTNPRTPYSRRPGEKAADWMAQVVEPRLRLGALLGFITSARQNGRVELEVRYDRFRRLEAVADGEGAAVPPGENCSSEWVLLSLSADPLRQQERYLELWGQAMNARQSRPRTGWCSWYFSFWRVSEEVINRNLRLLEERFKGVVEIVQIDDGFETLPGEWLTWNEKFPSPPAEIAQRIRTSGFEPGLWLAPFLVSRSAPLYQRHPHWVLRNERGWPLIAFLHPAWKGHVMYALDTTHPGVQNWLEETIRVLVRQYGFEYLKLDFLYAAALPGLRHDRRMTGAQALRKGLEIIRTAAGPDPYILGCGCPFGPAIGLVDAMRVSPDIDIRWQLPLMDTISGVPSGPGARNCFQNNLARLRMHARLWANDPDCVVMRPVRGGLRLPEIQSELTLYYLSGGALFLSEDLSSLPPERREWFYLMLPPSNEAARAMDLFEKDFPETILLRHEHSALLALFNWSDQSRSVAVDILRLGLPGTWHVFDYWAEMPRPTVTGRLEAGEIPPHGCRYLRLVRADGRRRLLAANFHLGMGEHGVSLEERDGRLEGRIELPGKRRGRIWVTGPAGEITVHEIEFEDRWEGVLG